MTYLEILNNIFCEVFPLKYLPYLCVRFITLGSGYQTLMTPHGGYSHPVSYESFVEEYFGNDIIRATKNALINGYALV